MKTYGIDVSNHQGEIDWDSVASSPDLRFAFIKASEGVDYRDRWFLRNWAESRRVGLIRGAYHFARPSENTPEEEADFFLRVVADAGGLEVGDLLALDMEDTDAAGDLLSWTLDFQEAIRERVGFRPLIYSGVWFMESHNLTGSAELAQDGLWLAAYQNEEPDSPDPWTFVAIWQYTDRLQVPGIRGLVDGDVFNGSAERLPLYGKPAGANP